jgi:hypothetical protein
MVFAELKDFIDPDLHLPFRGKTYTIPAASFEDGIYLQDMYTLGARAGSGKQDDADKAKIDDIDEIEFYNRALTPEVFQQLKDDKVPFSVVKLMATTAMTECVMDREAAEAYWASEGKVPKPAVKKPQDRKPRTATRTRTAAASTTRKPASRTTTSTPKAKEKDTPGGKS